VRVLLDTHTWYWYVEGDSQLSATAQKVIQDASNEILISPASHWEIAIKVSLGKWVLGGSFSEFIESGMKKYGFQVLPIEPSHTAVIVGLPFHHKDPFDRMLVAQAMAEGIPLVSSDSALDAYGISRLW